MKIEQQITQAIRKFLNDKQMSQSQLAALSNISETSISRYLNGKRDLYPNDIAKLASVLGMSFEELIHYPHPTVVSYIEDETITIHCKNLSQIHTIVITSQS